jgi:hypothetical protein
MFKPFKQAIQIRFAQLLATQAVLFLTDVDRDLMWETYLDSFESLEERQSHNCNCCRSFIKNYGNIVAIVDGKMITLWDVQTTDETDDYINAKLELNNLVLGSSIRDVFMSETIRIGTDSNTQSTEHGIVTWNHFSLDLPSKFVNRNAESIASIMGNHRSNKEVFKRSLDEISLDAIQTVLELIDQGSVYRGAEFREMVFSFLVQKTAYDAAGEKDIFCWLKSTQLPEYVTKIRSKAIGTLLTDVSEGKELDKAVESFGRKLDPSNYKRPSVAVVTKGQIEQAEKTITELGLLPSLGRRFATKEDISVNNLLFVNRDIKTALSVFAEMKEDVSVNPKSLSKVEEVSIDTFMKSILPHATGLEVMFENRHMGNLMSIFTAKDETASNLPKWPNPFTWSYANSVTDSIKENVKDAGGNVEGVLRFSIQWNDKGDNSIDFDAYAQEPGGSVISFRQYRFPEKTVSGGNLDVDIRIPGTKVAVENITWPSKGKLKKGTYHFWINNFESRTSRGGFSAQIEVDGEIHEFAYDKNLRGHEDIMVATVDFDGENFTVNPKLPSNSVTVSKEKWGLSTNKFHKVSMVMLSPNHWDSKTGNEHLFFILNGAKNDEPTRGFFNEFLPDNLLVHKRVFEALGSKMKVEYSDNQLSGLGFSSTQRNHLIVKVEGKFKRTVKINL